MQLVEKETDNSGDTVWVNRGNKGKQKEKEMEEQQNRWMLVGRDGRCKKQESGRCRINLGAIMKWQKHMEDRKKFARHLMDTNCTCCIEKQQMCMLPATKMMQEQVVLGLAPLMVKKKSRKSGVSWSQSPSVASSSKRRLDKWWNCC